ncbi:MAG TPA: 23S rRNA (guanosine(2251)-2'-O)-methyltransferase RlmB [Candidatus Binatia bacterium]|nr:23S rRNA (guanosine(2251)-2'-O)-methyltransferase RlmB [Candidatus Binatia bacterium]
MAKTNAHLNLIFGVNPLLEKLRASPRGIDEIFIAEGSNRGIVRLIRQEAERCGVKMRTIDGKSLDRLTGVRWHQGVAAHVRPYEYASFDDLLGEVASPTDRQWVLVLDGMTDPRNFGALLRTAEAVGIRHVVIPKDRSVDVNATVVKASAGAVHFLKVTKVTNLRRAIAHLKERGFWAVGLETESDQSIYDRVYPSRLAIVLGGEGQGVRPINLRECDIWVSIPIVGRIGSLNVSVAGGIFLYELLRQSKLAQR